MFSNGCSNRWEQSEKSVVSSAPGAFFMFMVLLVSLISTACTANEWPENSNCPPYAETHLVAIDHVIDGDTVRLGDNRTVRLIGVNTPELARDDRPDQPFARQARQELDQFLGRQALLLMGERSKDKHGRTLAHLYSLNGNSAAAHLLKKGLGWHIAVPPDIALAQCLAQAEQQAHHNGLALWGPNGIPAIPAEAVHRGGFHRIEGVVESIRFTRSGWWVNMGNQIAAVIYPEDQHYFKRSELEKLQGTTIEIRGWVYPSRSRKYQPWRMKLHTPFALR